MKHLSSFNLIVLAIFLMSFSGCAEEQRLVLSDASLKGKITYKGKSVPYALVIVMGGGGTSATGNADADGNYTIEHAPTGEVKIGVNTEAGKGNMMSATMAAAQGGDKSAKPTFVDVPAKFFDATTSGITANVTDSKGANTFDIDIK